VRSFSSGADAATAALIAWFTGTMSPECRKPGAARDPRSAQQQHRTVVLGGPPQRREEGPRKRAGPPPGRRGEPGPGGGRDRGEPLLPHRGEPAAKHLEVELVLAAEVVVDGRQVAAGGGGDVADRGSRVADAREQPGRVEQALRVRAVGVAGCRRRRGCGHEPISSNRMKRLWRASSLPPGPASAGHSGRRSPRYRAVDEVADEPKPWSRRSATYGVRKADVERGVRTAALVGRRRSAGDPRRSRLLSSEPWFGSPAVVGARRASARPRRRSPWAAPAGRWAGSAATAGWRAVEHRAADVQVSQVAGGSCGNDGVAQVRSHRRRR
jgi:hypothetical protein